MNKIAISVYLVFSLIFFSASVLFLWFLKTNNFNIKNKNLFNINKKRCYEFIRKYFSNYFRNLISWRYISFLERKIKFSGINISGLRFYCYQIIFALIPFVVVFFQGYSFLIWLCSSIVGGAICFFLPILFLNQKIAKKKQGFLDAFSFFLDLLVLNLSAGVSLRQGLKNASHYAQSKLLQANITRLVQELEQGSPVEQAWRNFSQYCDHEEVDAFVMTMLQAYRQGVPLQQVLRQQARQIKVVVYTAAEKKALALPTKLVFPILIFIFPITFIIISFPLVYRVLMNSIG